MARLPSTLLLTVFVGLAGGCEDRHPSAAPAAADRVVRLGMRSPPLSLDPHLRNEIVTQAVLSNIYEPLIGYDRDGRLYPVLAERWENPDDRTWRLVLRDGVHFHDGRALTADDAVFSLERARSHPETNFGSLMVEVISIRRLDARTLEITTRRPYPPLLSKLAFVLIAPRGSPDLITSPLGTGPYQLRDTTDITRIELERFDGYWGRPAPYTRALLLAEPDPRRRLAQLVAGEIDVMQTVPPDLVAGLAEDPCCRVRERDGLMFEYLVLDPRKPPFDDLRVRQAVDLAIDRTALVDRALLGHGTPLGQLSPINVFGHDPELGLPPHDPDHARRLQLEAGYPEGIEIVVETRSGRNVGLLIDQLRAAGMRASALELPWPEMYERRNSEVVAAYLGGLVAISGDASDVLDSLAHTRDLERGYGAHNLSGYSNPAVDRLIEDAGLAKDLRERRDLLGEALRLLREDSVYLPLLSRNEIHAVRQGVDLELRLDGMVRAIDVSPSPRER